MTVHTRLISTFNFRVTLQIDGESGSEIAEAAFSDCDGLEMTMEPKTIREGGNNARPIHLMGPVSYGQLSLKRGMSDTADLWDWFEKTMTEGGYGTRASGRVEVLSTDRTTSDDEDPEVVVAFALTGCLPIKIKCPTLSAKDGGIAIEEMQVAYETLRRIKAGEE